MDTFDLGCPFPDCKAEGTQLRMLGFQQEWREDEDGFWDISWSGYCPSCHTDFTVTRRSVKPVSLGPMPTDLRVVVDQQSRDDEKLSMFRQRDDEDPDV